MTITQTQTPAPTRNGHRPRTVTELFPDKWLKAAHLHTKDGAPFTATVLISAVSIEETRLPDGTKPLRAILSFRGKDKRLILNKTQALTLADMFHTENFEDWVGQTVALSPGKAPNGKGTVIIHRAQAPADPPPPANVNTTTGELLDLEDAPEEPPALAKPGNDLDEFFNAPTEEPAAAESTERSDADVPTPEEEAIWDGLKTQYDQLANRAQELGFPIPQVDGDTGIDELLQIVETTTAALDEITKKRKTAATSTRTESDLRILAEIDLLNEAAAAIGMSQLKVSPRTAGPELERMRDRLQLAINTKRQALAGQHARSQ